ncbi:MAG: aspartate/glutamate racemase family protein [Pseudomonadota bacterium]
MHIGLIGGIGPAATDAYYRRLVAEMRARDVPLEMTVVHADSPVLLRHLAAEDTGAQAEIFAGLTERLQAAGAGCVAVTSIAGHFCIDAFRTRSPLPVVDLLWTVREAVDALGHRCVGLMGTATVMRTGFYGALGPVQTLAPEGCDLETVHEAYVGIAAAGTASPERTATLLAAGQALVDRGADAVLLGGTDLALVYDPIEPPYPIIDCVEIHVAALVEMAAAP